MPPAGRRSVCEDLASEVGDDPGEGLGLGADSLPEWPEDAERASRTAGVKGASPACWSLGSSGKLVGRKGTRNTRVI